MLSKFFRLTAEFFKDLITTRNNCQTYVRIATGTDDVLFYADVAQRNGKQQ